VWPIPPRPCLLLPSYVRRCCFQLQPGALAPFLRHALRVYHWACGLPRLSSRVLGGVLVVLDAILDVDIDRMVHGAHHRACTSIMHHAPCIIPHLLGLLLMWTPVSRWPGEGTTAHEELWVCCLQQKMHCYPFPLSVNLDSELRLSCHLSPTISVSSLAPCVARLLTSGYRNVVRTPFSGSGSIGRESASHFRPPCSAALATRLCYMHSYIFLSYLHRSL